MTTEPALQIPARISRALRWRLRRSRPTLASVPAQDAISLVDPLTGLSTPEEFRREALDALQSGLERLTVAVLDIDGLGAIRGTLGREVADEVLRTTARVLKSQLRLGDTAARLEDDKFALLMRGATLADAGRVLQRVEDALPDAALDDDIGCVVQFCSGAAQWNGHEDYREFMARATLWLEAEKRSRKPGSVLALPITRDRRRGTG